LTGVRTFDGAQLAADLVIDATGRRSALPGWLAELGARPMAEQAEDSGFAYYTRDHYLDGERMEKSGGCVGGRWRYEVISGASHWIPPDAPDRLNELLLDWLS
jgi:hypothetical protein